MFSAEDLPPEFSSHRKTGELTNISSAGLTKKNQAKYNKAVLLIQRMVREKRQFFKRRDEARRLRGIINMQRYARMWMAKSERSKREIMHAAALDWNIAKTRLANTSVVLRENLLRSKKKRLSNEPLSPGAKFIPAAQAPPRSLVPLVQVSGETKLIGKHLHQATKLALDVSAHDARAARHKTASAVPQTMGALGGASDVRKNMTRGPTKCCRKASFVALPPSEYSGNAYSVRSSDLANRSAGMGKSVLDDSLPDESVLTEKSKWWAGNYKINSQWAHVKIFALDRRVMVQVVFYSTPEHMKKAKLKNKGAKNNKGEWAPSAVISPDPYIH
jgi:hypothetical protein